MDEQLLSENTKAETSSKEPLLVRNLSIKYRDFSQQWRKSSHHLHNAESFVSITPDSLLANHLANFTKKRKLIRRSNSAPSILTDAKGRFPDSSYPRPAAIQSVPLIAKQAFVGIVVYIIIGVLVFLLRRKSFKGTQSWGLVDALYFNVVTLCTIGYGDIVPDTTFTKLYTCGLILVGFGFIDILLNGLVRYVLDQQEAVLLSAVDENRFNKMVTTYMVDTAKGRMRIRMKVGLALAVVVGCIAVGTIMVHILEELSWDDSFYLSVSSVTTVGYGDYAFSTLEGRCFAIIWLLVSTLAVARAFLYLTELRIERRNRMTAKWVLEKKMTLGDLVAADLDHDGSVRYLLNLPGNFLSIAVPIIVNLNTSSTSLSKWAKLLTKTSSK